MKEFQKYLDSIDNPTHRQRMEQLLMHVSEKYPNSRGSQMGPAHVQRSWNIYNCF